MFKTITNCNIGIIRIGEKNKEKKTFEVKILPNDRYQATDPRISENSKQNKHQKPTHRHILSKLQNAKDKEEILKAERGGVGW